MVVVLGRVAIRRNKKLVHGPSINVCGMLTEVKNERQLRNDSDDRKSRELRRTWCPRSVVDPIGAPRSRRAGANFENSDWALIGVSEGKDSDYGCSWALALTLAWL